VGVGYFDVEFIYVALVALVALGRFVFASSHLLRSWDIALVAFIFWRFPGVTRVEIFHLERVYANSNYKGSMPRSGGLVRGVGLNDANYAVTKRERVNGKWKVVWRCPYYLRWNSMLSRCYSEACLKEHPSYEGSSVCVEWLTFSNFRRWMRQQQWIGFTEKGDIETLHLDKDFLSGSKRGKLYSPDTCAFISQSLNKFLEDSEKSRGGCPVGVYLHRGGKYVALVSNSITKKRECLGSFHDVQVAQAFYITRKKEIAVLLAGEQTDPRIAKALLEIDWS
jgi:hypothetical protein